MSRPLIIKVDDHKFQSNKKAVGSINIELLKGSTKNFYEKYSSENDNVSMVTDNIEHQKEDTAFSIVRNLISRYELSTSNQNLTKFKSKSMLDLQKPALVVTKISQDDHLYNRNKYNDDTENQKFDFQKVFAKFESSNQSRLKIKHNTTSFSSDTLELTDIQQKARQLLENRPNDSYLVWQNEVVDLLQQISSLGIVDSVTIHGRKTEDEIAPQKFSEKTQLERAKSLDSGEFDKVLKVRDITNIFEAKIDKDHNKHLSRQVSSYAYFGVQPDEVDQPGSSETPNKMGSDLHDNYDSNNEWESEESEDSDLHGEGSYDVEDERRKQLDNYEVEGGHLVVQPSLVSSEKIRELKSLYESAPVADKYLPYNEYLQNGDAPEHLSDSTLSSESENIHVINNRILPPPKIVTLDNQEEELNGPEYYIQKIEELSKDIEDYELQIAKLPVGNKDEGGYINEALIRILLKLDDVKTCGNEVILRERKKAIHFVQNCIKQLKDKVNGAQ